MEPSQPPIYYSANIRTKFCEQFQFDTICDAWFQFKEMQEHTIWNDQFITGYLQVSRTTESDAWYYMDQ